MGSADTANDSRGENTSTLATSRFRRPTGHPTLVPSRPGASILSEGGYHIPYPAYQVPAMLTETPTGSNHEAKRKPVRTCTQAICTNIVRQRATQKPGQRMRSWEGKSRYRARVKPRDGRQSQRDYSRTLCPVLHHRTEL